MVASTRVNIIAIVSKAIFEKELPGAGVGDVYPTSVYRSKNRTLEKLADGGTLWLVTVRPGGILWLVAVLRDPTWGDGGWNQQNDTPISDLTSLISEFRFASGKGLPVDRAKLGMALQTPRLLTDSDVRMLEAASQSAVSGSEGEESPTTTTVDESVVTKQASYEIADPGMKDIPVRALDASRSAMKTLRKHKLKTIGDVLDSFAVVESEEPRVGHELRNILPDFGIKIDGEPPPLEPRARALVQATQVEAPRVRKVKLVSTTHWQPEMQVAWCGDTKQALLFGGYLPGSTRAKLSDDDVVHSNRLLVFQPAKGTIEVAFPDSACEKNVDDRVIPRGQHAWIALGDGQFLLHGGISLDGYGVNYEDNGYGLQDILVFDSARGRWSEIRGPTQPGDRDRCSNGVTVALDATNNTALLIPRLDESRYSYESHELIDLEMDGALPDKVEVVSLATRKVSRRKCPPGLPLRGWRASATLGGQIALIGGSRELSSGDGWFSEKSGELTLFDTGSWRATPTALTATPRDRASAVEIGPHRVLCADGEEDEPWAIFDTEKRTVVEFSRPDGIEQFALLFRDEDTVYAVSGKDGADIQVHECSISDLPG